MEPDAIGSFSIMINFFHSRSNMLRMDVFFSELKYEAVTQQPAYDWPTYFSTYLVHASTSNSILLITF